MDRFRDSSTCAFFECEGARCGRTGASGCDGVISEVMTNGPVSFCLSKNDFDCSIAGVLGVAGDENSIDEASVLS